jgi:hypothetical protein
MRGSQVYNSLSKHPSVDSASGIPSAAYNAHMSHDKRRYRTLYVRIWREPRFRALSDAYKAATLYLLTGPQTNRMGCYVLSPALAAEDLNVTLPAFMKRLSVVCETFGWQWDKEARVFWIPSWWAWNAPDNARALSGALSDRNEIPACSLLTRCLALVADTYPQWYGIPIGKGITYQEQEQEKEQEQEQKQEAPTRVTAPIPDHPTRAQLRSMGTLVAPVNAHVYRHGPVDVTQKTHAALRQKAALRLRTADDPALDRFLGAFYDATEAGWLAAGGAPSGKSWEIWFAAYDAAYAVAAPTAGTQKTAGNVGVVQRFIERGQRA